MRSFSVAAILVLIQGSSSLIASNLPSCRHSRCVVASHSVDRRLLLQSPSAVAFGLALLGSPPLAGAKYGESSNIELPNYIEFLIEQNKSVDPDSILYKGADPQVLLKRLLEANTKLSEIPKLAEERKWSQVQGILTGPLGTLAQTLNQISKDASPAVQDAARKVKNDVIEIGQAATRKSESGCSSGAAKASKDLESLVKAAFQ